MTDLTAPQADWLSLFTGVAVDLPSATGAAVTPKDDDADIEKRYRMLRIKEMASEQALKEQLLTTAVARLAKHKDALRDGFDLKIKGRDGKKQALRDKEGQSQRAYDPYADGVQQAKKPKQMDATEIKHGDAALMADQGNTATTKLMELIVGEQQRLETVKTERSVVVTDPATKKKTIATAKESLFSEKEIMDEIWTPLVRELIVPETIVPDRFSATQKMIDGSNEFYVKECAEKGTNTDLGVTDVLASAKSLIAGVGSAAAAFELANGAASATVALTNMAVAAATLFVDVGGSIATGFDLDQATFSSIAGDLAAVSANALSASFSGSSNLDLKMLSSLVSGAIGSAASLFGAPLIASAKFLRDGQPDVFVDELGTAFASLVSNAMSFGLAGLQASPDVQNNPALAAALTAAIGFTQKEIVSVAKASVTAHQANLLQAYRAGQKSKFVTICNGIGADLLKSAVGVVGTLGQLDIKETVGKDEQQRANDALALQQAFANSATDSGSAGIKALNQWLESKEKDDLDHKKKKKEEVTTEDMAKRLDQEMAEFRQSLDTLNTSATDFPDFKTMDAMIKQAERDKIKWQTLMALANLSASAITAVLPAMNVAGELINFAMEGALLLKRTQAAYDWYQSHKDAVTAVSPYATSIANLWGNQTEQAMHHGFQAAAHLIQAALDLAAHFDPHGVCLAVSAGIGGAAAAEQSCYTLYNRVQLSRAWKQTAEALSNPKNRKAALVAREMNPTLAKYTIAYGALVENDPIATRAVNRIGLDNETLAHANSKVKDVAKYLKELYWEDNVVLDSRAPGLVAGQAKLKPPAAALTLEAWVKSLAFWREHAGLVKQETSPMIGKLLSQTGKFAEKKEEDMTLEEFDAYLLTLAKLSPAFRSFRIELDPDADVQTIGLRLEDVRKGVTLYVDLVEAKQVLVKDARERRAETDDGQREAEELALAA